MSPPTTDRLLDLLDQWEAARADGPEPTPEQLCPEDPALRDRLRAAIDQIKRMEPKADSADQTLDTDTPDLPGYQLTGELGRGSFGVVYRGRQLGLNREVAVKVLAGGGTTTTARFLAEAEAVAAAEHPNVVRVYDTGKASGRPFLVLEFCDGGTLAERLKAGRLPAAKAASLLEAVAGGVAAAHARQIVHRDLKPGNVLFAGGVPKVADFGLAKSATGPDLTASHAVMGTPAYMAPEQAGGGAKFVGPAADVWALGVMLYEALAGRRPFVASDTLGILEKVRAAEPASLRSVERTVPRELELVVAKCLAKEPTDRYPTAAELAADLGRWRRGEPVTARPVASTVRAWKWARRNPREAGLMAAVAVLLAAGTPVMGWLYLRQRAAAADAQRQERTARRALGNLQIATDAKQAAYQQEQKAHERTVEALRALTDRVIQDQQARRATLSAGDRRFLGRVADLWAGIAGQLRDDSLQVEGWQRVAETRTFLGDQAAAEEAARTATDLARLRLTGKPVDDDADRAAAARGHELLSRLHTAAGRLAEAESDARAAAALTAGRADPDCRRLHGRALAALALAYGNAGRTPEALAEYRAAVTALTDPPDAAGKRELAAAQAGLCRLCRGVGDWATGEPAGRAAAGLYAELAAADPDDTQAAYEAAAGRAELADLLADAGKLDHPDVGPGYVSAVVQLERLAADYPGTPHYRAKLAEVRTNHGLLHADLNRPADAEREYRAALALLARLTADAPAAPGHVRAAVSARQNLGNVLADAARWPEAEAERRTAVADGERLLAAHPGNPEHLADLAGSYCNLGNTLADSGRPADALAAFDQAQARVTAALAADPTRRGARTYLRNVHSGRARALVALGRHADALPDWDKMIELSPPAEHPRRRLMRLGSLFRAGRPDRGRAELAELARLGAWDAGQWYDLACGHMLAGDPAAAEAALRKAVGAGFTDWQHLRADSDLRPLRGRPDFDRLVAELRAKHPAAEAAPAPRPAGP